MNANYNYIVNLLTEIANGHPQLQDVRLSFKDQRSLFHEKAKGLPVLYANVENLRYLEYTCIWDIDIYIMDNIFDSRENEVSIMNNTGEIINHVINFVKNEKFNDYRFIDIGFAQPLNNYDNNKMNGWIFRTRIETKREQCYTPIKGGVVPILCEDAEWVLNDSQGTELNSGTIPSGGSETIVAPDGSVTVENSQGATVDGGAVVSGGSGVFNAPDAEYTVVNSLGGVLDQANIPSGESETISLGDTTVNLEDTQSNLLSTSQIPVGTIGLITAPDTNIEVNGTPEGQVPAGSTLDVQVTDGTNPVTPDDVTLVGQTLTIEVPSGAPAGWQRPADWLAMPTVVDTDDTFVALHAIFPSGQNYVAFRFTTDTGDYEVDWGDGNVDVVASNTTAEHEYDYSTYDPTDSTLTTRGYKQAIITVTPVTGQLETANFQFRFTTTPAQNQVYATGFLDCILSMPNANTGQSIVFGGTTVRHSYVERFQLLNLGNINNIQSMFQNCFLLQSVPLFNTSSVTTMNNMFQNCRSLQSVPLFDTSSVTTMINMFFNCTSLQSVPLFNTSTVTNMNDMFSICRSLQSVPLFDTSSVTNMQNMFQNCNSLQSVPLFDTSSVTTMSSMFDGCQSLQSVPLFDTSSVTNMQNMFQNCNSLQSVPLFDTSSVTTMSSMFSGCQSLQSVPLFDTSSVTNMGNTFVNCVSLDRTDIVCPVSVNFNNCQLSRTELVNIFNNLVDRTATTSANINISGNWGATALTTAERDIALDKNWTITG
jgi:surface protein